MQRILYVDLLRVLLALLVVTIHVNFLAESHAATGVAISGYLARVAVPLFFMISGYFFFHAIQHGRTRAWLWHGLRLYLVWSLLYLQLSFFAHPDLTLSQRSIDMLSSLLLPVWFLWFLHALPLVGAMTLWLQRYPIRPMLMLMLTLFLSGAVLQYLAAYGAWDDSPQRAWLTASPLYRNFLFVGLPFFFLGFLSARHRIGTDFSIARKTLLTVAGAAAMALEFALNRHFGNTGGFDVLFCLPLLAFALFMAAVHTAPRSRHRGLADLATVIYLVHPFFLFLLRKYSAIDGSVAMAVLAVAASVLVTPPLIALNRRIGVLL